MKVYMGKFPSYSFFNRIKNKIISLLIGKEYDRTVFIHVDDYDAWEAYHTIATIIVPILKRLRYIKIGSGFVENKDVPEKLRAPKDFDFNSGEMDKHFHSRFSYVLDEMIWAFEQELTDWDLEFSEKYHERYWENFEYLEHVKRMENGRRLFAKYFQNLWD